MHLTHFLAVILAVAHAASAQYVAEGYFVFDNAAVAVYERELTGISDPSARRMEAENRLREDLQYHLSEANEMLGSLQSLTIQIRIRAVLILGTDIFQSSDFTSQAQSTVNPNAALQRAALWLLDQNAYNQYNYDFALFYTGYNLDRSTGTAYTGRVCDPAMSVGIVQATSIFAQSIDTAIQLAHILGAPNDGPTSEYLEAYETKPSSKDRWDFSSCTATWIKELVDSLSPNCLSSTNPASSVPSINYGSYSGDLLDANTVCKRTLNSSNSYMCMENLFYNDERPKGDTVCKEIYCLVPQQGSSLCVSSYPSDGFICDTGKRCRDGSCVADSSPQSQNVKSNCVFGDQEVIQTATSSGSCADFISANGRFQCYFPDVQEVCCETCFDDTICDYSNPECAYGDKSRQCRDYTRNQVCPGNSDVCCEYCRGFVGKRSTDSHQIRLEIDIQYHAIINETKTERTHHHRDRIGY